MKELNGQEEGSFLVRMSQTDNETYSLSVVQDGQVRHIRVIATPDGFCINKSDTPCKSMNDLIVEKMGEKIKSKLSGGDTKETVLLKAPHKFKDDDAGSDDEGAMDMSAFLSSGNK